MDRITIDLKEFRLFRDQERESRAHGVMLSGFFKDNYQNPVKLYVAARDDNMIK